MQSFSTIGHPSRELVRPLLKCWSHPPPEDANCHDDEAERPETLAIGMRVIDKDHHEDAEGRVHHGVAGEEEAGVVDHASDHLDQEAGGAKGLERRVDLHQGHHDLHDVPKSPPVLKADAHVQAMEREVGAEIEHEEGKICRVPTACVIG